jgi:hypothetical protein
MENPMSWGKAEHVVNDVLRLHQLQEAAPTKPLIGLSLTRKITDALREEGLLVDPKPCPECAQGKHVNCTRQVLTEVEEIEPCPCMEAGHE